MLFWEEGLWLSGFFFQVTHPLAGQARSCVRLLYMEREERRVP